MMHKRLLSGFVLTCVAAGTAVADTLKWDTAAGDGAAITEGAGTWADGAGKWNNAVSDDVWDNAAPDSAVFGGGATASGTAGTVTLGGAITAGTVTFNTPKAGAYTLSTSTFGLTLNSGLALSANTNGTVQSGTGGSVILGNNNTWNVATSGRTLTVSSVVDDGASTYNLAKTGAGILALRGANTYGGATTVSSGILLLGVATATLGSTETGTVVQSGATLRIDDNMTLAEPLTLSGTGVGTAGDTFGALVMRKASGVLTLSGAITLAGGALITMYNGGNATVTLSEGIAGTGDLSLNSGAANNGSATYILKGQSTYSGNTILRTDKSVGITVRSDVANALPTTTVLRVQATAGTSTNTFGKYVLNGFDQEVAGVEGAIGVTGAYGYTNSIVGGSATRATLTVNNSADFTFGGRFGGLAANENNMALVKQGSGTLTLTFANTYGGPTTIQNGKLVGVVGGSCAGSAISNAATSGNTALLGITVSDNTRQWSCSSLTVNNAGSGSDLDFVFGTVTPSTTLAPLAASGDVTFVTAPVIMVRGTSLPVSTGDGYPLITWGSGAAPSLSGATLVLPPHVGGTLAVVGSTLYLQISENALQPMSWSGGDGTWDVNNSANTIWKDGGGADNSYAETAVGGDQVVFDDTVGSGGTVTLDTVVRPASLTASNNVAAYTISGSGAIAGDIPLLKQGAGALILSTTNTYTGVTTVEDGTLQLGAGGDSGSIDNTASINLSGAAAVLAVNRSTALTVNKRISGLGGLFKTGAGRLSIGASNTYGGVTTIAGGDLALTADTATLGSTAAGTVVSNGAALRLAQTETSMTLSEPLTLTGSGVGLSGDAYGALLMRRQAGQWTLSGAITLDSGAVMSTFNAGAASVTISLGIAGTGDLTLASIAANNGSATFILKGQGSYTGDTLVKTLSSQGVTLQSDIANALPITTVLRMQALSTASVSTTGKFKLNGHNQEVAGIEGGVGIVGGNTYSNSIVGGAAAMATLIVNNVTDFVFGGRLGGPAANENNLALVKKGSGMLTLGIANTYIGATVVSNGVLRLDDAQGLSAVSDVYIEPGAMIDLNFTGVNTVRRLYINGRMMTVDVAYGAARQPDSLSGSGYLLATEGSEPTGTILNVR